MPEPAETVRIFIASSTPNKRVARTFAGVLQNRGFQVKVWDEWVFWPNESTFDGLLRVSTDGDWSFVVHGVMEPGYHRQMSLSFSSRIPEMRVDNHG